MPGISELILTLVLIVAIGVATRIFGENTKKQAENLRDVARGRKSADQGIKDAGSLGKNPETGVYEPKSKDDDQTS